MRTLLMALFTFGLGLYTAEAIERKPGHVSSVATAPARVAPSGKATIRMLASPGIGGSSEAFLGLLELAPGAAVPEHADATAEYIYVLEGGGTITIDGTAHTLTTGSAVYMPPGAVVTYKNGDVPAKVVQMFAPAGPEKKYDGWADAQ